MLKQYWVVAAALMTLIGCQENPTEGTLSEGVSAVRFHSAGQAQVVPEMSKGTVPMAQGATVGVLAYQRSAAGAADVTTDVFKDMKTYAAGVAGALTPSLTDDSGSVTGGNADGMELHNGTYDFYAYSPAMKIEPDHHTVKGVGHYTDFMGAVVPAFAVSRSASDVELLFEHKCSKVRFNVVTAANMANHSLAADSVILYKMAVSPAGDFLLGGDIAPTLGNAGSICKLGRVEAAADNKSTSVWEVLLPKSSGVFDGDFHLKINNIRYVLKARDVKAMSFGKGVQYIFTAVVRQGSIDLVLKVASWDAVSGSVDAGEGGQAGSGSWDDGGGETGGNAGTNHSIVIGSWDHIDWNGSMGGNPDPVTGAIEVGSWTPAQVIVDAGGTQVADIDSWVKKTLAAQAGADHDGAVDGWGENGFQSDMGEAPEGVVQANCAIVKPGEAVTFDMEDRASRVALATASVAVDWSSEKDYTPLVVWQDVSGLVSNLIYEKATGYVVVATDATKGANGGNAVVGLFPKGTTNPAAGTCIWSWHVWVTDYRPDEAGVSTRAANTAYSVTGGQVHTYGTNFTTTNPGKVIMDRNLGATKAYNGRVPAASDATTVYRSFGLLYQWGRKDPFPGWDGVNVSTPAAVEVYGGSGTSPITLQTVPETSAIIGNNSLFYAIRNPFIFIYGSSTLYDWYANDAVNQNNVLWGHGGQKSIYDPCPKGWRIPPPGTWDDFTRTSNPAVPNQGTFPYYSAGVAGETYAVANYKATNGRLYKTMSGTGTPMAWYPALGNRDAGGNGRKGAIMNTGYYGYSWSNAPDDIKCLYLSFGPTEVVPRRSYYRAYGFPVRCIQE